jgi:hypothetical protein
LCVIKHKLLLHSFTGINQNNNAATIRVFPNPASDNLTIKFDRKGSFEIFSIDGKLIEAATVVSENVKLNVSTYSNGMYMIKFTDEKGNLSHSKFAKE